MSDLEEGGECCSATNLKSVVGPAAKLHLTVLVVKREPSDVNWTGRHKDSGWNIGAHALVRDHNVGGVGSIKGFARTVKE